MLPALNSPVRTSGSSRRNAFDQTASQTKPRILVVDDNVSIHRDFQQVLGTPKKTDTLRKFEAELFDIPPPCEKLEPDEPCFRLDYASRGEDAWDLVKNSVDDADPFALAFVDMRMPPGWNGIETSKKICEADSLVGIVICTAYSDFRWDQVIESVGNSERLHLLRKPFTTTQIRKIASVLCTKWARQRRRAS